MNYNYNVTEDNAILGRCASRTPTNYNQKQVRNTSASARCASRAPTNYNMMSCAAQSL